MGSGCADTDSHPGCSSKRLHPLAAGRYRDLHIPVQRKMSSREEDQIQAIGKFRPLEKDVVQAVDFWGGACRGPPGGRAVRKKKKKRDFFSEEFYLERQSSGDFKRVFHKVTASGKRVDFDCDHSPRQQSLDPRHNLNVDSPEAVSHMMETVAYLVNTVFLFCQGLLAGVALLHLYLTFQSRDDAFFLKVYAPSAGQVRRMFFLLSVASFVGACEKLSHEHRNRDTWRRRSVSERFEIVLFCGLYLVSLLFTLLSTPTDDDMYHTNEFERESNPEWFVTAVGTDTFTGEEEARSMGGDWKGKLYRWRVYVVVRFLCALVSWILLCKDLHRDLSRGRQYKVQLVSSVAELDRANARFLRMCGRGMEELDVKQIEELRRLQYIGLSESDMMLSRMNPASNLFN